MVFADTNIVLYSVSRLPGERRKRELAWEIMNRPDIAFSAQVMSEFFVQATRPGSGPSMSRELAQDFLRAMTLRAVCPITAEVVFGGVEISGRYQISYWDGLILSAARSLRCSIVYSEDLNAEQEYDGVLVVNPFLPAAD